MQRGVLQYLYIKIVKWKKGDKLNLYLNLIYRKKKNFFLIKKKGVGKIYKHGQDSYMYRVSSLKNLRVITSHFENYTLISQKSENYLLLKKIYWFNYRKSYI